MLTINVAVLKFGFLTFCLPHNLPALQPQTQTRCRRSLPLCGFLQCHACPLPPQTEESKGRKKAAQVDYDWDAVAGVHKPIIDHSIISRFPRAGRAPHVAYQPTEGLVGVKCAAGTGMVNPEYRCKIEMPT